MDPSLRRVMSRSRVAAGLLLAVAYVLGPAESRAGCTHPWVAPSGVASSSVERLSILEGPLAPSDGLPGRQPDRSPCANGACSPGPASPIAPVDRAPEVREHWGALAATTAGPIPSSRIRRLPTEVLHASLSSDPIDRPPR